MLILHQPDLCVSPVLHPCPYHGHVSGGSALHLPATAEPNHSRFPTLKHALWEVKLKFLNRKSSFVFSRRKKTLKKPPSIMSVGVSKSQEHTALQIADCLSAADGEKTSCCGAGADGSNVLRAGIDTSTYSAHANLFPKHRIRSQIIQRPESRARSIGVTLDLHQRIRTRAPGLQFRRSVMQNAAHELAFTSFP